MNALWLKLVVDIYIFQVYTPLCTISLTYLTKKHLIHILRVFYSSFSVSFVNFPYISVCWAICVLPSIFDSIFYLVKAVEYVGAGECNFHFSLPSFLFALFHFLIRRTNNRKRQRGSCYQEEEETSKKTVTCNS